MVMYYDTALDIDSSLFLLASQGSRFSPTNT